MVNSLQKNYDFAMDICNGILPLQLCNKIIISLQRNEKTYVAKNSGSNFVAKLLPILSHNCNKIITVQMFVTKNGGKWREIFCDGFAMDGSNCRGFCKRYYIFEPDYGNELNPLQICNKIVFSIKLSKI